MKTTGGTVSTVCYASKSFIASRLSTLKGVFWALIEHPEYIAKESGEVRKKHCHLFVEVLDGSRLNLDALRKYLEEPSEDASGLALGCMPFRPSKFVDWLPYCLHDSDYCKFKRLEKPYYDLPLLDVVTSNPDYLTETYSSLPRSSWLSPIRRIINAQNDGLSLVEYLDRENIPFNMINAISRVWRSLIDQEYYMRLNRMRDNLDVQQDVTDEEIEKTLKKVRLEELGKMDLPF